MASIIFNDLEAMTGKLIKGDITPIVYDMIKDSQYILEFVKEYDSQWKEEERVIHEKQNTDSDTNRTTGVSIEDWISEYCKPFSL